MPSVVAHISGCREIAEKLMLFRQKNKLGLPLALAGSIIVDLENTGILKRVHGRSEDFFKYLCRIDPKYAPLAFGMMTHEIVDSVMDREYTHPNDKEARSIIRAHDAQLSDMELASHLLLEHSLDSNLIEQQPEIVGFIERERSKIHKHHMRKMAYHLATFFDGNYPVVLSALEKYNTVDLRALNSIEGCSAFWAQYVFLIANKDDIVKMHTANPVRKIATTLRIGTAFAKFLVARNKEKLHVIFHNARARFKKNASVFKKANKKLERSLAKYATAYGLILK